jgi:hypothetical protein
MGLLVTFSGGTDEHSEFFVPVDNYKVLDEDLSQSWIFN